MNQLPIVHPEPVALPGPHGNTAKTRAGGADFKKILADFLSLGGGEVVPPQFIPLLLSAQAAAGGEQLGAPSTSLPFLLLESALNLPPQLLNAAEGTPAKTPTAENPPLTTGLNPGRNLTLEQLLTAERDPKPLAPNHNFMPVSNRPADNSGQMLFATAAKETGLMAGRQGGPEFTLPLNESQPPRLVRAGDTLPEGVPLGVKNVAPTLPREIQPLNLPAKAPEIVRQIAQQIRFHLESSGRAEIQLQPEHLGKMEVRLLLSEGQLTAHFLVDNARTAQLLQSNLGQFRQDLAGQGLNFGQIEVQVDSQLLDQGFGQEFSQRFTGQNGRDGPAAERKVKSGENHSFNPGAQSLIDMLA